MEYHCKHCGAKVVRRFSLWIDSGLVFPQYCRGNGAPLHEAVILHPLNTGNILTPLSS